MPSPPPGASFYWARAQRHGESLRRISLPLEDHGALCESPMVLVVPVDRIGGQGRPLATASGHHQGPECMGRVQDSSNTSFKSAAHVARLSIVAQLFVLKAVLSYVGQKRPVMLARHDSTSDILAGEET